MDRRRFLATVGTASALALAGCAGDGDGTATEPSTSGSPQPGTTTRPPTGDLANGSFEAGLTDWLVGRDLPTDPNTGAPVATDVAVRSAGGSGHGGRPVPAAADGSRVLELFIDGRQDDGTLWVQQQADLSGATELAVDVYSDQESFNTIAKVAVYAGALPDTPLSEVAFDTSAASEDHAGWKTYRYPVPQEPHGLVAVGISVVWETEVTRYLDHVRLA